MENVPDSSYDAHVASDGLSYGSVGVPSFGREEEPQLQVTCSPGTQTITTDSRVVWVGWSVGWSVGRSVGRTVGWTVGWTVVWCGANE